MMPMPSSTFRVVKVIDPSGEARERVGHPLHEDRNGSSMINRQSALRRCRPGTRAGAVAPPHPSLAAAPLPKPVMREPFSGLEGLA